MNLTHEILHSIKYKGNKALAKYLGQEYAKTVYEQLLSFEIQEVVPIPLHPRKKRLRGFNQAESFALGISEILKCRCNTKSLKRTSFTSTQTKKKRLERWKNVEGIFASHGQDLNNKNVLLVDDVITTGATLESAAKVILDQKPKSLGIITLAYAKG